MKARKPKPPATPAGTAPLREWLNHEHPLYQLAAVIHWQVFEEEFGTLYAEGVGRPALPTRLLVGLHYLKHLYNVSDEVVVASWPENPYWQYFCGEEYFQHAWPCHATSLVKWRERVGAAGIEQLLQASITSAQRASVLPAALLQRVNVDTTVQEKAIAFPTDARLYHKARRALVRLARALAYKLRQSYERLGKRALARQGRYAAAQQMQRARRETKQLRTYLGRVLRNLERFIGPLPAAQAQLLVLARRVLAQQRTDQGKVYRTCLQFPENRV